MVLEFEINSSLLLDQRTADPRYGQQERRFQANLEYDYWLIYFFIALQISTQIKLTLIENCKVGENYKIATSPWHSRVGGWRWGHEIVFPRSVTQKGASRIS